MSLLDEFISYLNEQVENHSIYVWGAQGQAHPTISESWIKSREKNDHNFSRAAAYWQAQVKLGYEKKLRAFDCSGLGMYFLQNRKGLFKNDLSANGMLRFCAPIKREELKKGDWVFRTHKDGENKGKAYHIGYVVDEKLNVIEAKGRSHGVIKAGLNSAGQSYWNTYGRPNVFLGDQSTPVSPDVEEFTPVVLKIQSPLLRGCHIKALQESLNAMGYPCGEADGIFGKLSRAGLSAFVEAHREEKA
ncbi:peptidoglycan-binding protein [Eubacteriales bacterium OttesenSCG-928-K08]|nr:peptidoglycan-binding protein [Eubacteriales bacterium OttesenSCG-928-K08]